MAKIKNSLWFLFILVTLLSSNTFAHCDSVEGPVVKASKKAIATGNVNHVLVWVRAEDEKVIKDLFTKVLNVRKLSDEAKELADNYFFETVVRIHRAGEGVSYTGLKPAGYEPEEGIAAADISLENNSTANIKFTSDKKSNDEVIELFNEVQSRKDYDVNDLAAGRSYVEAYVHFIHYVENMYSGKMEEEHHH